MSSPNKAEGSLWGAGPHPEGGGQARGLGHALGMPLPSSQGEVMSPDLEGFEDEEEVMEGVLWGCEGRPGSPADLDGGTLDYLADEAAMAILQQLTDRDDMGLRRNPSPESCYSEVSPLWANLKAGSRGGSARAYGLVGSQLPSTARLPLRGPVGGRVRGNRKKGAQNRSEVTVGRQRAFTEGLVGSPSDSESSDDFSEQHLLSFSLCGKKVGQAKPRGLQEKPRHASALVGDKFHRVPGSFLPSTPQQLATVAGRQSVAELDVSHRKPPSVVWGKEGSRPSYLPEAAAAAGGLPKVTPWPRKVAQEKKFPGGASKVAPQGTFPPWEQRVSAAALETATFPPVSGVPLLGSGKGVSLGPLGTKQPKHASAGHKSGARRKKGSLPVLVEEEEPERDPGPEFQLLTHSPGSSYRECSSGDSSSRAAGLLGHARPWALSQGEALLRGPTPCGNQEALGRPPALGRQQQPPGAEGCPRCPELQRQIYDLRLQLATMQSLVDKFPNL